MIILSAEGFDWDRGNRSKCQKHGATVAEIEEVFLGEPLVALDPKHSQTGDRLIAIGETLAERYAFVAFALRGLEGQQLIRPVSARYVHAEEIAAYEKSEEKGAGT
jgi:uncharacterized DUF497 family protein